MFSTSESSEWLEGWREAKVVGGGGRDDEANRKKEIRWREKRNVRAPM